MYNKQLYSRFWLIVGIITFVIIWILRGGQFDGNIITAAFSAAGITLLIDTVVFKLFIWKKYPDLFYRWLTNAPYLGGCWEGTIYSNFVMPGTDEKVEPIRAKLEITHDFESLHIKMETDKSYSSSYVSGIVIDEGKQKYLCYLYGNDADKDRDINPKHDGAVKLRIKHDGEIRLEGHYWTGRSSTGRMEFVRISKKNSLA